LLNPKVFIMTNTIAINVNSSNVSTPARKRTHSTAALQENDHGKVPPLSAFHAWRDNCDRLYIAWRADEAPFIATMFGSYNWFPFHREFWAEQNSRDPLFRRILGRMVAHLSQALDLGAVPIQLPFDWDAEFDCTEMTEEEVRCWAYRYAILRPHLFPHPLNDFAANREVLRLMAKEKFPLILAQSLRAPE
jgi:hypothetical protein